MDCAGMPAAPAKALLNVVRNTFPAIKRYIIYNKFNKL